MNKYENGFELKDRAMNREMKKYLKHLNRLKYFEEKKKEKARTTQA